GKRASAFQVSLDQQLVRPHCRHDRSILRVQLHIVMRAGPELPVLDHWKSETTPRARSRSDTPRSTANSTVISGLSSGPSSQFLIRRCLPLAAIESTSFVGLSLSPLAVTA